MDRYGPGLFPLEWLLLFGVTERGSLRSGPASPPPQGHPALDWSSGLLNARPRRLSKHPSQNQ